MSCNQLTCHFMQCGLHPSSLQLFGNITKKSRELYLRVPILLLYRKGHMSVENTKNSLYKVGSVTYMTWCISAFDNNFSLPQLIQDETKQATLRGIDMWVIFKSHFGKSVYSFNKYHGILSQKPHKLGMYSQFCSVNQWS